MVEAGDLDGLKRLTRNIPPTDLVKMSITGQYTPLIFAIDKERRDIVRWLVEEKHADVNLSVKNESALQRAIFRNNELIVKDLLDFGVDMNKKMFHTEWTMPLFAIMRDKPRLLDMMLERGASIEYDMTREHVRLLLVGKTKPIETVFFKH